jgi:hypothetical protein
MPNVMIDTSASAVAMVPNPGGQAAFAADWTHHSVAAEGGWMSGKTFVGALKLITLHLYNAFDSQGQPTGVPSLCGAPTIASLQDYDIPALKEVCDACNLSYEYRAQDRVLGKVLVLPDLGTKAEPSFIYLKSVERADRLAGFQVGAGWGDEPTRWPENRMEPKKDAYTQFQSRVRHPDARFIQELYTYTNEGDTTVMYEKFNSGSKGFALYRIPTWENPRALAYCEKQRETLTPELAKQYLGGDAVNLKGKLAYATFNKVRNVSKDLRLQKQLPLHLIFDFNINPGMHVLVGQYDPTADMFITTHEIHKPRMDLRQAIQAFGVLVKDELGGWQWPEIQAFGDATGEAKWAGTGQSCWQIIRQGLVDMDIKYRIRVPKGNPLQIDRINAMNIAMMDLRGKVHYQCHPRCVRLINDFKKVKTDEHGKLDKQALDLSHASDADGYRVHYLRPARLEMNKTSRGRIGYTSPGTLPQTG